MNIKELLFTYAMQQMFSVFQILAFLSRKKHLMTRFTWQSTDILTVLPLPYTAIRYPSDKDITVFLIMPQSWNHCVILQSHAMFFLYRWEYYDNKYLKKVLLREKPMTKEHGILRTHSKLSLKDAMHSMHSGFSSTNLQANGKNGQSLLRLISNWSVTSLQDQ